LRSRAAKRAEEENFGPAIFTGLIGLLRVVVVRDWVGMELSFELELGEWMTVSPERV
jgi:hypothetical protein